MKRVNTYLFIFLSFFFFSLLLFSDLSFAQSYWIHRGGGTAVDEGMDIAVDANGNTYATGYFSGVVTFGASPSTTVSLTAAGVSDIYVVKINSSGVVQWAVKAGGAGSDRGLAIAVDASGNSYATGFFQGTATFGSVTLNASSGSQDVFVAKYNTSGTLQWAKNAGGTNVDIGNGIAVDASGNVIVTGQFMETAQFGSLSLTAMKNPSTSMSSIDIFTAKYDASGKELWAKKGSAPYTDRGLDVACDPSGNIYVTGQFSDTISFDVVHNNNAYNAIFIIKYNSSGAEQWFQRIGGGTQNIAYGIAVDANGNIYLTGDFINNLIFFLTPTNTILNNTSNNSIFIAKYNSAGKFQWAEADTSSSEISSRNIALDGSGNPYIIGNFKCKFSEYAKEYGDGTFNSIGYHDIFVAKYDASGKRQWAQQFGGQYEDNGAGIALDASSQIYTTGAFNQRINFPVASVSNSNWNYVSSAGGAAPSNYCSGSSYSTFYYTTSLGYSDIFIAKALDQSRQPYDYYKRGSGCDKSFVGTCINKDYYYSETTCAADSVVACGQMTLYDVSNTASSVYNIGTVGPNYNYLWSTSATSRSINVTTTGKYSVTLTTVDGCFKSSDTIFATINPFPSTPTVSPQSTLLCAPDSVKITFANIDAGTTHTLTGTGLPANGIDTNVVTAVMTTPGSKNYTYTVTNKYGCSRSISAWVTLQSAPTPLDTIGPKVKLLNDPDQNDSVGFCAGGYFQLMIYDSIKNPSGNNASIPNMTNVSWAISPATSYYYWSNPTTTFYPSASGWYQLDGTITLSTSTSCGTKSLTYKVSKKVYVTVVPYPTVNNPISGNTVICQGQSTTLSVPKADSYSWYNASVGGTTGITTATNTDSIQVNQTGTYCNTSTITQSGCSKNGTSCKSITLRTAPAITFNPSTGLICPNDSVTLTTTSGTKYEWYGPTKTGQGLVGSVQSIKVNIPGYYYCVVTDTAGCVLTSNTAEVKQYATPFLYATPNTFMCAGDKVTLYAATSVGSTLEWQSPLSGNALSQTVTTAGTYTCKVTSCGIVTMASLKITAANVVATITGAKGICEGDSVVLTANKGMSGYEWSPNKSYNDTIVVKQTGTFTVKTTDGNGCTITSTPVTVTVSKKLAPPTATDATVCKGAKATLTASSAGTIEWYSDSLGKTKIGTGTQYVTPALTKDTVYYVQTPVAYCDTVRVPVKIIINAASFTPTVKSNSPVCEGDTLKLTTDTAIKVTYAWTGPNSFTSNLQNPTIANAVSANAGNYTLTLTGGGCSSPPASTTVVVKPTPAMPVISSNSPICAGEAVLLTSNTVADAIYNWSGVNNFSSSLQNPTVPNTTVKDSGDYSLTVTVNGCPSPKATISVNIKPVPASPNLRTNSPVCEKDSITFFADSVADGTYNWTGTNNFSSNLQNPTIKIGNADYAGVYSGTVTVDGCTSPVKNLIVVVNPLPQINIHKENFICPEEEIVILNAGNNDSIYIWQDFSTGRTYTVVAPGIYWVSVTSNAGCTISDTATIDDGCPPKLYVPNAFTPNKDNRNNVFYAVGSYITAFQMKIFNRWGQLIFETKDLNTGWDGKFQGLDVQQDVYVWVIHYEGLLKEKTVKFDETGRVVLIR